MNIFNNLFFLILNWYTITRWVDTLLLSNTLSWFCANQFLLLLLKGVMWPHGSWIYNYICNQCIKPLKLWVWIPLMVRCTRYNIMWQSLSVTCGRSVVVSGSSGFLHQYNWPPRYNWNIVENGIKYHKPNPTITRCHNFMV